MTRPILVIGVARRSGTNFLWRLLRCHPDCSTPTDVLEDHVVTRLDLLDHYVAATSGYWDPSWGDTAGARDALRRALGDALERFLHGLAPGARPLVKTPDATNLVRLPVYLPDVDVLVLVRDGRSVAESAVRGFGLDHATAFRTWRDGAREVIRYVRDDPTRRAQVVRYEDLVEDTEGQVRRILVQVGLDPERFDWSAALDLPVYGSSFHRGSVRDLHWDPVERPAGFAPTRRYGDWPAELHDRFAWVAGDEMRELGYPIGTPGGGALRHRTADLADDLRAASSRVVRRLRSRGRSRG